MSVPVRDRQLSNAVFSVLLNGEGQWCRYFKVLFFSYENLWFFLVINTVESNFVSVVNHGAQFIFIWCSVYLTDFLKYVFKISSYLHSEI